MASDPQTWAELKTSLADWLNRSDLTSKLPELIALAERRFNRVLTVPERETSATATLSSERLALPTDFWALRNIFIDSDPRQPLTQVPLSQVIDGFDYVGKPVVFAISGSELVFGPQPDASYTVQITYQATIPALGASQATNWLLTAHPDIYLYGSLLMAEAYLVNDPRIELWKAALDEAMGELMAAGNRKRAFASPMRLRSPVTI